jgi:acetyltransferase-like isoleucine patch superfamily enzyme
MKIIKSCFRSLIEYSIKHLSSTLGRKIRYKYYKNKFAHCGKNVRIDEGVIIEGAENMHIGDNVWIDKNVILIAGKTDVPEKFITNKSSFEKNEGCLYIGDNSHLGISTIIQAHGIVRIENHFTSSAGCKIYSLSNDVQKCHKGTHGSDDIYYIKSAITIESNVWLGLNSVVLNGTLEKNSFVTPFTIIKKSFEANSIISGNPAKKIKARFVNLT